MICLTDQKTIQHSTIHSFDHGKPSDPSETLMGIWSGGMMAESEIVPGVTIREYLEISRAMARTVERK